MWYTDYMIPRKETDVLLEQAQKHVISVLTGCRQVGKSTLMQIIQDRLGGQSAYYNLENPAHLALFNEGYSSFKRQNDASLVFIDEFQYCKDISSIFKAVYDLDPGIKIYASGSSSLEIQAHLKESLVGRKLERIIYPLSYSEWLTQFDPPVPAVLPPGQITPLDLCEVYAKMLDEFMRFGAMPALTHLESETEKREYLHGIYQTYIAKDIKSFLKDESVLAFNKMITYLALNNGSLLNRNILSVVSGVSSRQIERHVDVMQGTYAVALVHPLSNNKTKELVKTPKYYFYDQGVLNAILQDFRPWHLRSDRGIMNEQFVFWELKKNLDVSYQIKFWRTSDGKEVDFVIEKDRQYLPIEVKSGWPGGKIPSGISHFFSYYPETMRAIVLYDGPEKITMLGDKTVHFLPLWKAGLITM